MNQNFDPMTGEPITQPETPTEAMNFDPMTGEPIHQAAVETIPEVTEPVTTEETVAKEEPVTAEATATSNPYSVPQGTMNFDPQTGMPMGTTTDIPAPKKKGKKGILAILAVILIAIAAVLVFVFTRETPKERVFNGMEATFLETNSPLNQLLGSKDLEEMILKKGSSETFSLTLDSLDGALLGDYADFAYMLEGFGVQSSFDLDMKSKELKASGAVTYAGISYLNCDIFAYDDILAFQCPELLDGYFSVNTKTIGEDFNSSYIGESSGESIDEDVSFNIFDELKSMQNEDSYAGTSIAMKKTLDEAYDSIVVKKTTSEKLTIGGKDQTCDGYTVTIPADSMENVVNALIEEAAAESTEEFNTEEILTYLKPVTENDFVFTVYLDKKDRMVRLEQNYEILDGTTTIDTLLDWSGKESLCDAFNGTIDISAMGMTYNLVLTSNTTTDGDVATTDVYCSIGTDGTELGNLSYYSTLDTKDGDFQMDLSVADTTQTYAALTATGAFTDINKGKGYTLTLDNMNLDVMDGSLNLDLSAAYTIGEYADNITLPEGTEYQALKMTEEEFATVASEIDSKLSTSPFFELILSFVTGY